VSQIFEALTIAQDRAVEKMVERQESNKEPLESSPKRFVFTHKKIRNYLILAFFTVGLALLATNYAFNGNGVLAKGQPVTGVVFESTVHPASEFSITADLSGTVSDIAVKVGDAVHQGQPLVHMDGREAELALHEAAADLHAAQLNLDASRGQLADANARLAMSQRAEQQIPTRQWRDSPDRAQAAYDLAKDNYDRTKALYEARVAPKQDLDARGTELRIAKDDLDNAKKLAEASSKLEQDQSEQAKVQTQVVHEELAEQLRQAQLKYQRAKHQAEAKVVRATQDGVVSEIPVHLGDHVFLGANLIRVAELDHMVAEVPVAARMISELHVGQLAQISLPTAPPREVAGKIRLINPLPSPNMTHLVEVEFDNPTLLLLAGQSAEVRFSKP
jgi:multidrug resistance efflux pump